MNSFQTYRKLFASTFYLSAFTFGGGYVIVPLMKKKFVDELHWIEETEMLDLTAIAHSAPGAMAINASILIGYRIAGFIGAIVTILGTVLPPLIILSVISLFYQTFQSNQIVKIVLKGMQAGVAAVVIDVVYTMAKGIVSQKQLLPIIIMIISFIAGYFLSINVMYIILICGVFGAVNGFHEEKARKERS